MKALISLLLLGFAATVVGGLALLWYVLPQLPSVETLREVQLQTPLRVYAAGGELIAEYGEKRRYPVSMPQVPPLMVQAFLAAEDDRFYSHPGVDWMAIARAVIELLETRQKSQGGSTITMQVARNFFLSPEKTYERKLKEVVLAMIIERELSKDEILELYLNKIFLGHRAYGIAAAAQVYYGATLSELTLAEMAMIAGLPKAPSRTNPISNPQAALERRNYVLGRMHKLGFISDAEFQNAGQQPNTARWHGQAIGVSAPHVAEMVRDFMESRYGDDIYSSGFKVTTTVDARLQGAATDALSAGLQDYGRRHGYRGAESHYSLPPDHSSDSWALAVDGFRTVGDQVPAVVVATQEKSAIVWARGRGALTVPWDGLKWARKKLGVDSLGPAPASADDIIKPGDIIRVHYEHETPTEALGKNVVGAGHWALTQLPEVEGALVSIDTRDGRVRALVGGFDYSQSKFNRVTQARRQPGSNFKPFIYSAALDNGFTPASFINDAPIVFDAPGLESAWRPENYSGSYFGPTRLREALTKSRNLVSIRLLRSIGVEKGLEYVQRFGFDTAALPHNLSLALGSGEVSPYELVTAYATLANGGYKVEPFFVEEIYDSEGKRIYQAAPAAVCNVCENFALDGDGEPVDLASLTAMEALPPQRRAPRVVAADNAWLMASMLKDVIKYGTGRRARSLKRNDLAGKTGTTNDQKDAWFSGFNRDLATTVWVGSDRSVPLGRYETGAKAALPIWIDYMRTALEGVPEASLEKPEGLVTVRIDPETGLLVGADHSDAMFEYFRPDQVPARGDGAEETGGGGRSSRPSIPEQLF